jgi:hypothetical protein
MLAVVIISRVPTGIEISFNGYNPTEFKAAIISAINSCSNRNLHEKLLFLVECQDQILTMK